MFRKIILVLLIGSSFSFAMSANMVQSVKKEKLGCIKGLGVKRVNALITYRKNHHINTLDELLNIKGIGKVILKNIKEDKEKKVCTRFIQEKNKKKKKGGNRKKDIKAE